MDIRIQLQQALAECERLRKENEYLKHILSMMMQKKENNHSVTMASSIVNNQSSPEEKIRLFKQLFRGRTDVYAVRWESKNGRAGYTPACAYEWQPPICRKPEIKCSECQHRSLLPLNDQVLYDHLSGKHTVGIYPMQKDETCFFLAIDFDKRIGKRMCWRLFVYVKSFPYRIVLNAQDLGMVHTYGFSSPKRFLLH